MLNIAWKTPTNSKYFQLSFTCLTNYFKFLSGFYSILLKTGALCTGSKHAGIPAQAVVGTGFPELDGSWSTKRDIWQILYTYSKCINTTNPQSIQNIEMTLATRICFDNILGKSNFCLVRKIIHPNIFVYWFTKMRY